MANDQPTDTQLIARVAQRDRSAFEVLYERHARHVLGLAIRLVGERAAGEEIAQEALWRVWKRAELFDARRGNFSTWLASIVHHLAIDELRRRGHAVSIEWDPDDSQLLGLPDPTPDTDERVWVNLQGAQIRSALAELPEAQRRVIELAYFEGLTHLEISGRLQEPLGTIHTRARLGLAKLKELLVELRSR